MMSFPHRSRSQNYGAIFALGLISPAIIGCNGEERATVTGIVSQHDGTPLVGGLVIARSEQSGKNAVGETDAEGHFQLNAGEAGAGVAPGDYSVIVQPGRLKLEASSQAIVARKYRSPATSGLSLSVAGGEEKTLDIKLDPP